MKFNPVFMLMFPREIQSVVESVKSVVNIPRVWFKAYNERDVMAMMNKFVENTDYTHYIISSDDAIVYKKAFDTCLKYGARDDVEVFSGYSNMHIEKPLSRYKDGTERRVITDLTNVHDVPLKLTSSSGPTHSDYPSWLTLDKVLSSGGLFRQYMASMGLTCYSRELLLEFPLYVYPNGYSSDHHISYRLQKAGIKVWTHPDAFQLHLRQGWSGFAGSPLGSENSIWTLGTMKPRVILELDTSDHEVMSKEINSKYHLEEFGVEVISTESLARVK